MSHSLFKTIFYLFVAFSFSLECRAQFSGGMSAMDHSRQQRKYLEGYKKKKENGESLDGYYRSQTNFNFCPVSATYTLDYVYEEFSLNETTPFAGVVTAKIKGSAYGLGLEHYFPLGKIDDKSLVALTIGLDALFYKLESPEIRLNGGKKFTPEFDIWQFNIPVGFVYKTGSDVVFRKNEKSGFSFGGGAVLREITDLKSLPTFGVRPYCMAEVSFFAGLCWKIRGTAFLGKSTLMKGTEYLGSGGSENESTMNLTTKSNLMLSLIFTEFSWDWEKD